MNRLLWFSVCAILGLAMLVAGLLMPIHIRAVEVSVIQRAGKSSAWLDHGLSLVRDEKLGAADLLVQGAPTQNFPDPDKLQSAIKGASARRPALMASGGDASMVIQRLFASDPQSGKNASEPLTEFVVRLENRDVVLGLLNGSGNPAVQELLKCRLLTNTTTFSPSSSASGQAFDAAISVAGLLIEENRLTPKLRDSIQKLAADANGGLGSQALEQSLLDLMSLGQRMNWGQLAAFTAHIEDTETLRVLADQARNDSQMAVLFSAVELSSQPAAVAHYVLNFSQTGMTDLGTSLRFGPGGVDELLLRNQRLTQNPYLTPALVSSPIISPIYQFALNCARWTPNLALALKWMAYLASGFFMAAAVHFARRPVSALERPLQVRGVHILREILFALGFLLVVLILSEPFLAQESQKTDVPFRLHLPRVGSIVPTGTAPTHPSIMNQSIITLLLFFVLQGLLYLGSLLKLAEIRRQNAPPRVKLKLLENEDHLFDAGLYLGFVGTIISFILASLGVTKLSLMGAYSSTSFGIVFVSVFKIFQLRPARRKLLLEAESNPAEYVSSANTPATAPALAPTP